MLRRNRIILCSGIVLLGAAALVTGIGYALPVAHVAARDAVVHAPPERVFARISDPAAYRQWRPDVEAVEIVAASPLRWRERAGGDVITYEVVESNAPHRFVSRIADDSLPFGGTWTWELRPEGDATRVTITERGEVYNPVFRFMSRFVFSQTATMENVLRRLQEAEDRPAK